MRSGMWYRAVLNVEQLEAGFVGAICTQFTKAIRSAGEPEGACLFVSNRETHACAGETDTDEEPARDDVLYFSPASVKVVPHMIVHYRARPCPPPERNRVELLVGQPDDWDLLPHSTH